MNTTDTTAAVISEARTMTGLTAAAFDYDISIHGIGGLYGPLGQAAYTIAASDMPGATTDERETAWHATWAALQPELAAYATRCRNRKYTGWSDASRGPIRYSN